LSRGTKLQSPLPPSNNRDSVGLAEPASKVSVIFGKKAARAAPRRADVDLVNKPAQPFVQELLTLIKLLSGRAVRRQSKPRG